ncbi:MAG: helix-turn-helix transcriptional regulator [Pseudomonadota bacterium]
MAADNKPDNGLQRAADVTAQDREFLVALGRRVRDIRERRGMSRRALSASSGVSERFLAQLESGEGNASIVLLRHVAEALGAGLRELLGGGDEPVEQRLVRRFLERLPAHRLEDVLFRLMREFGQEEAERKRRIALVGLRGAGKSTLGRALAAELGVPFIELDREVETEAGMSLSEVFMLYGQAGYRRIERQALQRVLERADAAVISAGGGIVSETETYNLLLAKCLTVWVKASPEEHMARVVAQGDLRPMEGSGEAMEDLRRILAAREPLYGKADVVIDTTGQSPGESLLKLRQAIAL